LTHDGGSITVTFLDPSSFGPVTATEAFEVERQKAQQQHFDEVGEPELGDAAVVLHLDDARDIVMVRIGDEVFQVTAAFSDTRVVTEDALIDFAAQLAAEVTATS